MLDFLSKVHGFIGKLGGKRFLVSAVGAIVILGGAMGWWDEATVSQYTEAAIGYLFVQSSFDKLTGGATSSTGTP